MKVEVGINILNHYLIFLNDCPSIPRNNAELLGIDREKYVEILLSCNGFLSHNDSFLSNDNFRDFIYFKNKEDAEEAIKMLEPYIMMATLTK